MKYSFNRIYEEINAPEYEIPVISTDVPITSSHGVYEPIIWLRFIFYIFFNVYAKFLNSILYEWSYFIMIVLLTLNNYKYLLVKKAVVQTLISVIIWIW